MCLDLEYSFYQNKNDKEKNNYMKKVMNLHFTSLISENVTILGNREGGGGVGCEETFSQAKLSNGTNMR